MDSAAQVRYEVRELTPEEVAARWDELAPAIARGVDRAHREFTLDDVRAQIDKGLAQVVTCEADGAVQAVCVVQVIQYDRMRALRVWIMGGVGLAIWQEVLMKGLEGLGRHRGAARLEVGVRRGLVPILARMGFEYAYTEMVRAI